MNIEPLEQFLDKYTNWYEYCDDDIPNRDINTFEFNLNFPYLIMNKLPCSYSNMTNAGKTIFKEIRQLDDEALESMETERLIHPVILSEHIIMELIEMEKEFDDIINQRTINTLQDINTIIL